jgi:hypothetical protein
MLKITPLMLIQNNGQCNSLFIIISQCMGKKCTHPIFSYSLGREYFPVLPPDGMCMCVWGCVHVCMVMCMWVYVCVSVGICLCMYVCVHVRACVHGSGYVCEFGMQVFVYVCMWEGMHMCVFMWVRWVSVYGCMCGCVWICGVRVCMLCALFPTSNSFFTSSPGLLLLYAKSCFVREIRQMS